MEPIDYQALVALRDRLNSISRAGGYYNDVQAALVKLDPNQAVEELVAADRPRPFIFIELRNDFFRWEEKPDGIVHMLELTVHVVNDSDATDDWARWRTFCRDCADVEVAIAVDRSFGDLVFETNLMRRKLAGVDGSEVWSTIQLEMPIYRTFGVPSS